MSGAFPPIFVGLRGFYHGSQGSYHETHGTYQRVAEFLPLTNVESFKPNVNATRFNDHGVLEANGACTQ